MTNSSFKLGIIAFANSGGLAVQTQRLVKMLNPHRVLVIDSSKFSKNKKHDFSFFKDYDHFITQGFPKNYDVIKFIDGLTHVLTVENPYNFYLIHACRERGIRTICQTNYEFCENVFASWLPIPDLFLMPSPWKVEEMIEKFGLRHVLYLPPPINPNEFREVRKINRNRRGKPRFLHIIGTLAHRDRNGTLDLLKALKFAKGDFELVIKSQHKLPSKYKSNDKRVSYEIGNVERNADLYKDFDALILPRRYGGLSLTTNEALMSGLPVIMTNISPNKELLPKTWLVPVSRGRGFKARMVVDCYSADPGLLAKKIDKFALKEFKLLKLNAYMLGIDNFSVKILKSYYEQILGYL